MTLASTGSTSLDLGKPVEDETFCGPICQHPACWQSKQRKEKGFPRYTCLAQSLPEPLETDLPNLTMYNLLEDYGHDPSDRYPVRFDGHWLYHTEDDKDAAISARPRKPLPPTPRSNGRCVEHVPELHVVEVQEVFDLDDLNNKWDETFLTKQCYMWVPNPSRTPRVTTESLQSPPTSAIEAAYRQHPVLVKDHTEEMMPQEIERHREQTKVFDEFPVIKKKISQGSSLVHPRTLIRTPRLSSSGKPRVDTEGLKDLLNLPRDVLMQVLDHLRESDFTSKEKVRSVIQRVRPQVEPVVAKGRLSPIAPVFVQQQKVKLLQGKTRNVRQPSVITQPVFQLDNDDKHSDDLQVKGLGRDRDRDVSKDVYTSSEIETRDAYSLQGFAKYRKALPEIGTIAYSEGGCSPRLYRSKLPSVSLGLPELPFGVSQIRPFTYKNRQYLDLSIGPVPSPPSTSCSSEFGGSDHGTTVRPNMTSASTRLDKDLYGVVYDPQYTKPKSPRGTLRSRSPARSSRTRKSPHHLVASRQSVPKSASGQHAADKAREISMSPVPKFQAPANSPNQSPTTSPPPPVISVTSGLNEASMVPCVNDSEQKMFSEEPSSTISLATYMCKPEYFEMDRMVSFDIQAPKATITVKKEHSAIEAIHRLFKATMDVSVFDSGQKTSDVQIQSAVIPEPVTMDAAVVDSRQEETNEASTVHTNSVSVTSKVPVYQEIDRMDSFETEVPKPTIIVKKTNFVNEVILDEDEVTMDTTDSQQETNGAKKCDESAFISGMCQVDSTIKDSQQKDTSDIHVDVQSGPIISKVPVVEDTVKEAEKPETKPLTDTVPTDSELMKADEPETCSPALYVAPEYPSPDVWPEVSEAAYELASMPASKEETEQASSSEQLIQIPTSTSRSKSNGKESDRESLVRKMMDDTKNVQSPAPPPPSPELKGLKKAESAQGKSHDSLVMEPLYEECGEVVDSLASAPAAGESPVEDDPGTATYVSHVAPLGSSHRGNEMTEHSFVNVDIPADMPPGSDKTNGDGTVRSSLKSDADGTTYRSNIPSSAGVSAAGYITERTLTGEIASDECEDSSPDLLFKGRMPVSKTTNGSMTQGVLPETSKREVLEDSESTTDTEKINMEPRPCNAPREIDGAESDFFMGEADIIRTSTDNDDDQGQDIQVSDPVDADSSESKMNTEAPVSNERVAGETPGGDVREEEEVVTGQVEEQAGDAAGEGEAKDTDQDISNEQH
ncbi:uncharacterized protein LOC121383139 isoform X2 [Gigantopelta aegis]|uniref:uncharacterized protein LOC121383139 isoform X2 n=1 Tax=Gigantopelta aegis TaxID=1735272 RepID=UPI001B88E373|nr:uncharacterized protein LOC121383139 isoform X2 [Gigantopelta aegis]